VASQAGPSPIPRGPCHTPDPPITPAAGICELLLLSHGVRVHRKLRRAGVDAALQVYEGQSHAQHLDPFIPETEEAMTEIAKFLMRRLAA
jgi:monoterpene epsilon-lactone hydrolase